MTVALWIVQIVLALAFLGAGVAKITQPLDKLAETMGWVEDFSPGVVRAIGAAEVLGALGLVLPVVLDVVPVLTPVAAIGLVVVMAGAAVVHVRRKEPALVAVNLVLAALAIFVAVGRLSA